MRNVLGISGWLGVVCLTLAGPAYQAAGQGGKVINSIGMEFRKSGSNSVDFGSSSVVCSTGL